MGYQVWSSVLGQSLTTVSYNESKLKTMVYAGGALIATQVRGATADIVTFHTADPVTGTTMLMGDNGTYTYKEESEPLGQRSSRLTLRVFGVLMVRGFLINIENYII